MGVRRSAEGVRNTQANVAWDENQYDDRSEVTNYIWHNYPACSQNRIALPTEKSTRTARRSQDSDANQDRARGNCGIQCH